ncbi:MAG: BMC domain-containing protein [Synergistetes bacterium]|nr:BMC domain-containing protein [Synergistota bacterium]
MLDTMLKAANVSVYFASTTCPGKFLIIIGGHVSAVKTALDAGLNAGKEMVADYMMLPNIHPQVIPALACAAEVEEINDLGVVESMAAPAILEAADAACKTARVRLIEIRIGKGMGSKSFFSLTGDISDVKRAVEVAKSIVAAKGFLVEAVVISKPHNSLLDMI